MDYVWQARRQTKFHRTQADGWAAAANLVEQKRSDRDTCDRVTIEILRPGVVIPIQVKHEKRRHRPDEHSDKNGGVAFREIGTSARRGVAILGRHLVVHIK